MKKNQYFRPIFSDATDGIIISNSIFDQNRFHNAPQIEFNFIFMKVYVNRFIRSSCRAPRAMKNAVFRKTHSKFESTRVPDRRRFCSTDCDFKNILYWIDNWYWIDNRLFPTNETRYYSQQVSVNYIFTICFETGKWLYSPFVGKIAAVVKSAIFRLKTDGESTIFTRRVGKISFYSRVLNTLRMQIWKTKKTIFFIVNNCNLPLTVSKIKFSDTATLFSM